MHSSTYIKSTLLRRPSFCTYGNDTFNKTHQLGSGTYGKVSVFHSQQGSSIVIKEIDFISLNMEISDSIEEYISQIEIDIVDATREAKLNKKVHGVGEAIFHKRIVEIGGRSSEIPIPVTAYLIMKKLSPSLDILFSNDHFKRKHLSTPKNFLEFYLKILQATKKLHAKFGIIHGDLKLKNICIDEKNSEIVFCDFGLARELDDGKTGKPEYTSGRWGKCLYLPPELADEIPADPKQDVYSLGSILVCPKDNTLTLGAYSNKEVLDSKVIKELSKLGEQMRSVNPQQRPTVDQAIAKVETLIASQQLGYSKALRWISPNKEKSVPGYPQVSLLQR